MHLTDHLIYFDITNTCNLACRFCMYRERHRQPPRNLILSGKSEENAARLINDPDTMEVVISGEGEPFCNERALIGLLSLSNGNKPFTIVTNGKWSPEMLTNRFETFHARAQRSGDKYTFRISLDSFHIAQLVPATYGSFLRLMNERGRDLPHVGMSFRSILEQRSFVRQFLQGVLADLRMKSPDVVATSPLDDMITLDNGRVVPISYKNLVYPLRAGVLSPISVDQYITAAEHKYGKPFTFGNMAAKRADLGLDITVRPEGTVYFYGMETEAVADLACGSLDCRHLIQIVAGNPVFNCLYQRPLPTVLQHLRMNREVRRIIQQVNNPYWIIREVFQQNPAIVREAAENHD